MTYQFLQPCENKIDSVKNTPRVGHRPPLSGISRFKQMNAVLTSWAFGFGGWIGVFGSTFLFLNVPHMYTLLTMLLSPWIGGISLYLLMFATHAWINVSVQVAQAMTKYEIIMAVLTSFIGVLIVGIARLIIDMERGHRTPAQAAAEESAQASTQTSPDASEVSQESEKEDSDSESGEEQDSDEESSDGDSEDGSESGESESEEEHTDDSANDGDNENSSLNDARVDDSSSSSYENINTPQLRAVTTNESPVPNIPDI